MRLARLKLWKIIPMLPRTARAWRPESLPRVCSPTVTSPEVTGTSPLIGRISVDVPEPESPTTETISPASMSRVTPSRAVTPPG